MSRIKTILVHFGSNREKRLIFPPDSYIVSKLFSIFAPYYEKNRNEKNRNMENPFKFGTIVEEEYFTDRVKEVAYICQFVNSPNHLILISPRRFGKSSVVTKAIKQTGRKFITVNLQQVTSVADPELSFGYTDQ